MKAMTYDCGFGESIRFLDSFKSRNSDWWKPRPQISVSFTESETEVETVSAELERRFIQLAGQWKKETGGLSSTIRRYAHPAYQSILVELGTKAVPFILQELKERPDWWFEALKLLTKSDPTAPKSTFDDAVKAWLTWGRSQRIIS